MTGGRTTLQKKATNCKKKDRTADISQHKGDVSRQWFRCKLKLPHAMMTEKDNEGQKC